MKYTYEYLNKCKYFLKNIKFVNFIYLFYLNLLKKVDF